MLEFKTFPHELILNKLSKSLGEPELKNLTNGE